MIVRPQKGYQEKVLSCNADIVFGGGSAGAGKSFSLLLEPIRCFHIDGFRGVIFRKTMPQIKGGGGLWDQSESLYSGISGAKQSNGSALWRFSRGAELKFSHLEHDKDVYSHQGLQYAFIGFDELTHFSKKQFFYLLSRNRSTCGVKPYIRATCNPDSESWVKEFIERYLDKDGYVIKERDGVIRYFTIDKSNVVWGNTKKEVIDKCPHIFSEMKEKGQDLDVYIKSFTFVEGSLEENKELLEKDPTYKANLMAQDEQTKKALLERCWNPIQDDLSIVDYEKLDCIETNFIEESTFRSLSCDIAGYGKDLAIIKVWIGWHCIATYIYTKSSPELLFDEIEKLRKEHKIMSCNVVYDNDGIGWGLSGKKYTSFSGNAIPIELNGVKDNYRNLKTQCYYRVIEEIINKGLIRIENNFFLDGLKTKVTSINGKEYEIIKLLKADIRAIKRGKSIDGGKLTINSKEEQKNILGRSPDFGDTIMMRYLFELKKKKSLIIL